MYAVVGIWEMDPELADVQAAALERIAADVAQLPGLVKGYWSDFPEPGRSHTFIAFERRDQAESFAADVRGNTANQNHAGVRNLSLDVVSVRAAT